ncbi:TIGR04255 family protein [Delftia acidovorans]|uniref:TIGR04255 family protein n=1 Tax=Delftia acidovorans TaxID=80866 RepID=UPI002FDEDB33
MIDKSIQPISGVHAIEVMAMGIEWVEPLNKQQLAKLQQVYENSAELKVFLPQISTVKKLSIKQVHELPVGDQNEPRMVQPPQFISEDAGFDIRRIEIDGKLSWSASVHSEVLAFTCHKYDRWHLVKPNALKVLTAIVEAALACGAKIKVIGLQYQDCFKLTEGISPKITNELFRRDGKWIPGHIFDEPSYWHSHQGWFSSGLGGRRILNNVNVDISDSENTCLARIGGQHRVFSASFDGAQELPIDLNELDNVLDFLHIENKNVINNMLSDKALLSIGCKPKEVVNE